MVDGWLLDRRAIQPAKAAILLARARCHGAGMILFAAATLRELEYLVRGDIPLDKTGSSCTVQRFRGVEAVFLVCGIGPLNAAINLERCLERNKGIRHVVNVGIAGSYDLDSFPLGSVCIASREVWPEYGVRSGNFFADPYSLGFPLAEIQPEPVWNSIELETVNFSRETGLSLDRDWKKGVSITLAGISSSWSQARDLQTRFHGDMENMEGFALAYCCRLRSVSFVEVRSISNPAGSRNRKEWDFKGALHALGSIWASLWRKA